MDSKKTYHLLSSILKILKMMIEAGAEIYRIEESANMIFRAYGFKNVDVYATTTNIIISVEAEDDIIKTHTRRIEKISTDIEKIHRLNSLVREVTATTPEYGHIEKEIEKIEKGKKYPIAVTIFFYGIIAGAFYFFFGGREWIEFLISTAIGICSGILNEAFDKLDFNKILAKFLLSFVAALIATLLRSVHVVSHLEYIMISNIMTLIPGIGLTNSLRDLFVGDNISGALRLIEAGLSALAIACGYVAATSLFGGVM